MLHYEKAAEVMETDFHAWAMLIELLPALGDKEKLRDAARRWCQRPKRRFSRIRATARHSAFWPAAMPLLGDEERTREWIERALLIDPDNLNMRYNFACVLAAHLGDKEGAIRMLQSTLSARRLLPGQDR